MYLSLSADVTVTARSTFVNLADVEDRRSLVGIAQSASQGAVTARQLDARPIMRTGEVLETVPGVVISQHSGEGKANQYYLRGVQPGSRHRFRDDRGRHAREHADSRAWPWLFGPQLPHPRADQRRPVLEGAVLCRQGDFATAGAATIAYTNSLTRPLVRIGGGDEGFGRALAAASSRSAAAPCSREWRCRGMTGRGCTPTISASSTV